MVAERGADADALAKICGVLEPEESLRLVKSLPGVECLILTADGQVIRSRAGTAWNGRGRHCSRWLGSEMPLLRL